MEPISKTPVAVLDYGIDWSTWLATGELITSSTWTIPPGLTLVDDYVAGAVAVAWLSGGTLGDSYTIRNSITTNSSPVQRVETRQLVIWVSDAA